MVTTEWLAAHLDDPQVRVVEVDEDTGAYARGHIPGAVAWNWSRDLRHPVRRDFADQESLSRLLAGAGVDGETLVVLYGGNDNWFAVYAYWLLEFRGFDRPVLLDGGRRKFWFVLHELLGHPQVKNYDGSWTEYGSLVDVPVERDAGSGAGSTPRQAMP